MATGKDEFRSARRTPAEESYGGESSGEGERQRAAGSTIPAQPQARNDSTTDFRSPAATDGVSGFVGYLIRKGIVSKALVDSAVAAKKNRGDQDRRLLFQILIEEFGRSEERRVGKECRL